MRQERIYKDKDSVNF